MQIEAEHLVTIMALSKEVDSLKTALEQAHRIRKKDLLASKEISSGGDGDDFACFERIGSGSDFDAIDNNINP